MSDQITIPDTSSGSTFNDRNTVIILNPEERIIVLPDGGGSGGATSFDGRVRMNSVDTATFLDDKLGVEFSNDGSVFNLRLDPSTLQLNESNQVTALLPPTPTLQTVTDAGRTTDNYTVFTGGAGSSQSTTTRYGFNAATTNTIDAQWTAYGFSAGQLNRTGFSWTALGRAAGRNNVTGGNWTAIGTDSAMNATGSSFISIGGDAAVGNTTGSDWVAIGRRAAATLLTGSSATSFSNSTYVGFTTRVSANGVQNENVFGYRANGIGSNTVRLGNDDITGVHTSGTFITTATIPLSSAPGGTNATAGFVLTANGIGGSSWTANATPSLQTVTEVGGTSDQDLTLTGANIILGDEDGATVNVFGDAAVENQSVYVGTSEAGFEASGTEVSMSGSGTDGSGNSATISIDSGNPSGIDLSGNNVRLLTNDIIIGRNTGNRSIIANTVGTDEPEIRYDGRSLTWQYSNNGSQFFEFGGGAMDAPTLQVVTTAGATSNVALTLTGGIRSSANNNERFGTNALSSSTTSNWNSAFGSGTLQGLTSGTNNSAFGYQALTDVVSGTNNSAFGRRALSNTTSSFNCAFGSQSLIASISGMRNTAVGFNALGANVTGADNTAVGSGAGGLFTGSNNTFIGSNTASSNQSGAFFNSTALGINAIFTAAHQVRLGDTGLVEVSTSGTLNSSNASPLGSAPGGTNATSGFVLTANGTGGSAWLAGGGGSTPTLQEVTTAGNTSTLDVQVGRMQVGGTRTASNADLSVRLTTGNDLAHVFYFGNVLNAAPVFRVDSNRTVTNSFTVFRDGTVNVSDGVTMRPANVTAAVADVNYCMSVGANTGTNSARFVGNILSEGTGTFVNTVQQNSLVSFDSALTALASGGRIRLENNSNVFGNRRGIEFEGPGSNGLMGAISMVNRGSAGTGSFGDLVIVMKRTITPGSSSMTEAMRFSPQAPTSTDPSVTNINASTSNLTVQRVSAFDNIHIITKYTPTRRPLNPAMGWMYTDTNDNHLYWYSGTAWVQLD